MLRPQVRTKYLQSTLVMSDKNVIILAFQLAMDEFMSANQISEDLIFNFPRETFGRLHPVPESVVLFFT